MKHKLEKFEMATVPRSEFHEADYNPRKISKKNKEELSRDLKGLGLLSPIVVNKRTGNVVAGHQRLAILDEAAKGKEYSLTVAYVDLSEKDEVKANVLMNNQSVMGEFDFPMLAGLQEAFDVDITKGFGFDKDDLVILATQSGDDSLLESVIGSNLGRKEYSALEQAANLEKMKAEKKHLRELSKNDNEKGDSHNPVKDDYLLTFTFGSTPEKKDFCKKMGLKESERFIDANYLYRIEAGEFKKKL